MSVVWVGSCSRCLIRSQEHFLSLIISSLSDPFPFNSSLFFLFPLVLFTSPFSFCVILCLSQTFYWICFCVCMVKRTRLDFLFMFDIKYICTENLNSMFFTFYSFMLFLFLLLFSLSPPFVLLLIKVLVNSMLRLFFWSQLWWAISFVNVGGESYYRTDFTFCFFFAFCYMTWILFLLNGVSQTALTLHILLCFSAAGRGTSSKLFMPGATWRKK